MDTTGPLTVLEVLLLAMLGMFTMAIFFVVFFVAYQRKLMQQHKQHNQALASHQQALLQATVQSQEKERNRIARDLHDDIGAMLSTIKLYANQAGTGDREESLVLSKKMGRLLDDTLQTVRRISYDLHPVILKNFGLQEALQSLMERIDAESDIQTTCAFAPGLPVLAYDKELAIYRIVQELVSNSLKYASPSRLWLSISCKHAAWRLTYKDDGPGYEVNPELKNTGLGLRNIETRAQLIGAKVQYLQAGGRTRAQLTMILIRHE
ncbi:sensor histidine kinase [Roseivirga sp. BDSF3-8]|uniref:sensor histidine kinase n=1 Tax=Roseivirga sp. BDSF3-8 TaxID=3241598 RepID=UPI003532675D